MGASVRLPLTHIHLNIKMNKVTMRRMAHCSGKRRSKVTKQSTTLDKKPNQTFNICY